MKNEFTVAVVGTERIEVGQMLTIGNETVYVTSVENHRVTYRAITFRQYLRLMWQWIRFRARIAPAQIKWIAVDLRNWLIKLKDIK